MIAVLFEVIPTREGKESYFAMAKNLFPELSTMDGFISIERFESLVQPGKYLSLSFWKDEESIRKWRTCEPHRYAQHMGRTELFQDYRLRVMSVIRDYGMLKRSQCPVDNRLFFQE